MIPRQQLHDYYQALLRPESYADYCPNGLQVEGAEQIEHIAFAVSATRDSINQAIENKADALVVHHGLLWTFHGAKPLTGAFAKRIFPLVKKRHQPVRLSSAAGWAPGHRQCRDFGSVDRLQAATAVRRLQRLGDRH